MPENLPATLRLADHRSGRVLDRAALALAAARRQASFAAAGVAPGGRLVLGHGEGAAFLVDLFAAWRLGAVAVAVPPSLTAGERERVAAATGAALWVGAAAPAGLPALAPELPTAAEPAAPLPAAAADPDAPALVLMTSGTTAEPKGVVHTRRSLGTRVALNLAHMDPADLARSLSMLPMHFGHGLIGNCLTPLAAGASLTLWPEPGVAGLAALGAAIDDGGITFLSSVPAMWRIALKASPPPRKGTLRRVHVGSAPLSAELWRATAAWCGTGRVVNMYGATETANWIGGHSLEHGARDGLVGRPWGGSVRVMLADGTLAAAGDGEVVVRSPSRMRGYLDRPDLTAAAFRDGWFLTGDRGTIDAEGRLTLIGRRRHEINRGGIKVPAEEIDRLLERHPGVAAACAFGIEDPVAGEIVAAAVVPARPGALAEGDLLRWCEARIRSEARPQRLFLVGALPQSDRGKVNREAVRAAVLGREAEAVQR